MAILLPGFNVASQLPVVLKELALLPSVAGGDWVPVVIDDGSRDGTAAAAAAAKAVVLRHERNRGKGAALSTGFRWAVAEGFDGVITMDADGQHESASIPLLVQAAVAEGADIVVGNRMHRVDRMPPLRIWTNRTTSAVISRLAGHRIADSQSGFRFIRTDVLRHMRIVSTRYDAESELLIRAARRGYRIVEVPIRSVYQGSESHIHPVVDTLRFLRMLWRSLFVWRKDD